jgi:uncharacterized membrane protein
VTPDSDKKQPRWTVLHKLCAAVAVSVLVAVGLIVAGVAMLFGAGWALIAAGILLCASAISGAVVLLKDTAPAQPVSSVRYAA